jgi:hypothetical protein
MLGGFSDTGGTGRATGNAAGKTAGRGMAPQRSPIIKSGMLKLFSNGDKDFHF